MSGQTAVFLDRDGVIIEDVHYLSRVQDIHLIAGAAEAIRRLNEARIPVVVVTNQSAVAQGIIPESFVLEAHAHLDQLLAREGARIDRYYYCPHHPKNGNAPYLVDCECRKPKPGMLLAAARDLSVELPQSWMIGDKITDLQAGAAAGCRTILVRTGHGSEMELPENMSALRLEADVPAIADAVEIFFQRPV